MNRKVIFNGSKQVDEFTVKTGGELSYCYFHDESISVHLDGGKLREVIPLSGLEEADRNTIEQFAALLCRLTADEVVNCTAKNRDAAIKIEAKNQKKD